MTKTRGPLAIVTATLLTLALTVLAIYATYISTHLSLPTPALASILSLLLPTLTLLSTLFYSRLRLFLPSKLPRISPSFVLSVLAILDAVLLALSSSDLRPRVQACLLEGRWQEAWRAKDEGVIRVIQDALGCCGLRNTHHNAWPFVDRENGVDACVLRYHREESCQGPLRGRQQLVLGTGVAIAVCGLLVKALFLALARERPEWIGLRVGDHARVRGMITGAEEDAEGRDTSTRYLDQPQGAAQDLLGDDVESGGRMLGHGEST